MYIAIKEKTNNIFKVKIFQLLPLSIHNLFIDTYICILGFLTDTAPQNSYFIVYSNFYLHINRTECLLFQ